MLSIGQLDRRIILQQATVNTDSMGGNEYVWDSIEFSDWAFVEWKSGKSEDNEDKLQTTMSVEFTIRNNSAKQQSVNANKWRIAFPTEGGIVSITDTQYYTVTGITIWGGREKYKTLITELNANEFPTL